MLTKISILIAALEEAKCRYGDIVVAWESGSGYIFGNGQFDIEWDVVDREDDMDDPVLLEPEKVFVISSGCNRLYDLAARDAISND